MSTSLPATAFDLTAPRPSPLVERVFGEPQFHTDGDIASVAFAPDDSVWSFDEAGLLRHWAADGKLLARHYLSDSETVWCFGPGAQLLASGGKDDVLIWDVAGGQLLNRIEQASWVTAIAFSSDGHVLASGHDNGTVRFWDARSQKFLGQIAAHPTAVSAIAFSPKGDFIATAGEDRVVRVWDDCTHKLVAELKSHTDRIPSLAWSPDGSLLISAGWDTSARVWQPPQAEPLKLLNSHAEQVHTLAYSPDGKYLACADSDFDIYLWTDPADGEVAHTLFGHGDDIRCMAFNHDGTKLASAGVDRVVHIWDVRTGKLLAGPNPRGKHSIAVVEGKPSKLVSTAAPSVRVWDIENGAEAPPTGLGSAFSVAASPDGKWLAIGGTDHLTRLCLTADGVVVATLEATKPPVGALAFSPNSQQLIHTSPADGLVWLWDCATAQPVLILIEASDGCTLETVAFHPNGIWVACGGIDYLSTGDRDGALFVWDLTTKEKRAGVDVGVYAVAFDSTGKYLAGAGVNDMVFLWDGDTLDTIFELAGHQEKVNAVVFDPTGSYLLSGGDDMTVRVWDVLSGRLIVVREFDSSIQSLAFSADGHYLFCGNGNTTCYQLEFKKLLED